jgi:hypothetical protein
MQIAPHLLPLLAFIPLSSRTSGLQYAFVDSGRPQTSARSTRARACNHLLVTPMSVQLAPCIALPGSAPMIVSSPLGRLQHAQDPYTSTTSAPLSTRFHIIATPLPLYRYRLPRPRGRESEPPHGPGRTKPLPPTVIDHARRGASHRTAPKAPHLLVR